MRTFLPFVTLLGAAFLLGCQEQGSGPLEPEGPQFDKPGGGGQTMCKENTGFEEVSNHYFVATDGDTHILDCSENTDGEEITKRLWIEGSPGVDVIIGGSGNDYIRAGGGNDVIDGGPGKDWIEGDRGEDILVGGDGPDFIRGGPGDDFLCGGVLNPTVVQNFIVAESPANFVCGADNSDRDELVGGSDNDTCDEGDGDLLDDKKAPKSCENIV